MTIFYDPRGQAVRTVNPDGSEQRVVLGVPADLSRPGPLPADAVGDLHLRRQRQRRPHPPRGVPAAYQDHWNTPASAEVDALGRTVRAVARNGTDPADWFTTRSAYDIQGNLISVTDALGRAAFRYRFDLAKRRWRMDSIDAGRRDTVLDALGHPVETRDSKGALTLATFDLLHRPTRVWARDDGTGRRSPCGSGSTTATPATRSSLPPTGPRPGHATCSAAPPATTTRPGWSPPARSTSRATRLQVARRVIADAPILATYEQAAANGWQVEPFQVDWTPAPGQTQAERDAELLEASRIRHQHGVRRAQPGHPAHPPARRRRSAPRAPPGLQPGRRAGAGPPRRHPLRPAHRLRRQGPAHPDRLRQRRDDPLRLRPANVPAHPAAQRAVHAHRRGRRPTYRPHGAGAAGLRLRLRPGRQHPHHPRPHARQRHPQQPRRLRRGRHGRRRAAGQRRRAGPALHLRPGLPAALRHRPRIPGPAPRGPVDRPPRGTDITQARPTPSATATTPPATCSSSPTPAIGGFTRDFTVDGGQQPAPAHDRRRDPVRLHLRRQRQHDRRDHVAATSTGTTPTSCAAFAHPDRTAPSPPCTRSTSTTPPASG